MTGSELKDARRKLGYSRRELATATGLSPSTIARYEMGSNVGKYPIPQWLCTLIEMWEMMSKIRKP